MIRSLCIVCSLVSSVILAIAVGCDSSPKPIGNPAAAEQSTADTAAEGGKVELQVLNFDEIQKLIASHKGKVVVMDAWATTCTPCVKEFPGLVKLHQKYGPEKIACISLSFDNEGIDPLDEVKPLVLGFLKQQQATFDNVISSEETDKLYEKFNLTGVPAVYVYDTEGKEHKRFDNEDGGEFTYEDVGKVVATLMEPSADGGAEESNP